MPRPRVLAADAPVRLADRQRAQAVAWQRRESQGHGSCPATDPNTIAIVATYDDLGRKLTVDDPDRGPWSYGWDGLVTTTVPAVDAVLSSGPRSSSWRKAMRYPGLPQQRDL